MAAMGCNPTSERTSKAQLGPLSLKYIERIPLGNVQASRQNKHKQFTQYLFMIPINLHAVNTSLLALPVAVTITRKLLLSHRVSVTIESGSPTEQMRHIERRANTLTETLKNIVGYSHHGLNE